MPGSSELGRLLRLRKRLKSRKPRFLRTLWWKYPKFSNNPKWRKPKGIDNPMRLRRKGYPPSVEIGYGAPAAVRGLHPSGLRPVRVSNPAELESLNPREHIVVVASSVGLRKKLQIIEKARSLGLRVANP